MVRILKNDSMSVERECDGTSYLGHVIDIDSPNITLDFHNEVDLKIGDMVKCEIMREGSTLCVRGKVAEINGLRGTFTLLVEQVVEGVERAPRAFAPGLTVSITCGDETVIGSLCDLSESGLRVRTLGEYEDDQEVKLQMETDMGSINFTGRIARVVRGVDNASNDIGIQILEMERLERARYNHFVDGLLRKARKAG